MWQRRLDQALADGVAPAWPEWRPLVAQLAPNISEDSFAPILAGRLAAISRAGVDAKQLLRAAALGKPLPDDHAAAALWWRICRHLNPALSAQINRPAVPTVPWESRLAELIGTDRAAAHPDQSLVAGLSYGSRSRTATRLAARRPHLRTR